MSSVRERYLQARWPGLLRAPDGSVPITVGPGQHRASHDLPPYSSRGSCYMTAGIEDYGMIGDCETAALVSKDGSLDWLCWPRFDSGACFAALLGDAGNGRWRIA